MDGLRGENYSGMVRSAGGPRQSRRVVGRWWAGCSASSVRKATNSPRQTSSATGPPWSSGAWIDRLKTAYAIEIAEGAGETHFYEALKYALKELEKEGQRRKAIVVLTDGLDTNMRNSDRTTLSKAKTDEEALAMIDPHSSPDLTTVLASADRQGVTIYPLALPSGDPKRLPLPSPNITGIYAAARARLQSLADRTGGRLNEIDRLQYMAQLYREVAANLRSLYTVAYQPQGDRVRGKWHEIKVEVVPADLTARTKPGYFAR